MIQKCVDTFAMDFFFYLFYLFYLFYFIYFIDLLIKILLNYINLFTSDKYEKNDKTILKYFQ